MTVSSATSVVKLIATGLSASFDYDFIIPFQADGVTPAVIVQTMTEAGDINQLSYPSGFSITGVGAPEGGTVTLASGAPIAGTEITIARGLNYVQPVEVENTTFYPHTVELVADQDVEQIQQVARDINSTLRGPLGEVLDRLPPAVLRANTIQGWDAAGDWFLYPITPISGTINAANVEYDPPWIGAIPRTVASRLGDIASLKDFGAACDGVTDDAAAVLLANASDAEMIYVPARTLSTEYLTKPSWGSDCIVDGFNCTSNNPDGKKMLTPIPVNTVPLNQVAVQKLSPTRYRFFMQIYGPTWIVCDLNNAGVSGTGDGHDVDGNLLPYSWGRIVARQIFEFIVAQSAGVVETGTWTDLNSTDSGPYIGHHAVQSDTATDLLTIEIDGEGDVYVVFVGRTNGCYVKVEIDGSGDLVNALPEFGGYKYIDTFTPVDLTFRQQVLIARNLPPKGSPYSLTLTLTTDKNPLAGSGNRFLFNAVLLSGGSFGQPWKPGVAPDPWLPSTAYLQYDEVIGPTGNVYVCTVAGTSAASGGPTWTNGSGTDGTVTWLVLQNSSYQTLSTWIQAEGSQLEYAYEFKPDGHTPREAVGGNVHGHEYVVEDGWSLYVDAANVSDLAVGDFAYGSTVVMRQEIQAYWGELDGTFVNIANTVLTHTFTNGPRVTVKWSTTFSADGELGYCYMAMWPLLAYTIQNFQAVIDTVEIPQAGVMPPTNWPSVAGTVRAGRTRDYMQVATGQIYRPVGTAGVPVAGNGQFSIQCGLLIDPGAVGNYDQSESFAFMDPNLSGVAARSGFASWVAKMYFQRVGTEVGRFEGVLIGDTIGNQAEYTFSLTPI